MNITLISAGSRGDIAPFAALATALQGAGHETTLLAHDEFIGLLGNSGTRFVAARGRNPRDIIDSPEGRKLLSSARSPRGFAREFRNLVEPVVGTAFEDSLDASEDAELVIYSPMAFGAFNAAEKLGITSVQLHLQPALPSRRYPSVLSPVRSLGPVGNRISHAMSERVLSDAIRELLNRERRDVLGLPPRTGKNLFADQRLLEPCPVLAFDDVLVPRAPEWPEGAHQPGALLLGTEPGGRLPEDIERFLEAGPAVYFGFGSMTVDAPAAIVEAIDASTAELGLRAIVQRGWGGFAPSEAASQLLFIDEVDHALLFPRVTAIVHHGGAGTTARAIRSGRPSLVAPIMGDQFFWGHRSVAAGVGPASLHADRIDAKTLTARLSALVSDPSYAARASELGRQLAARDPLARAVEAVEAVTPERCSPSSSASF